MPNRYAANSAATNGAYHMRRVGAVTEQFKNNQRFATVTLLGTCGHVLTNIHKTGSPFSSLARSLEVSIYTHTGRKRGYRCIECPKGN